MRENVVIGTRDRSEAVLNELLLQLIDRLSLPLEERAARRVLSDFTADAGFNCFAFVHLRGNESFAVSNYPREWQDEYVEKGYVQLDPVVTKAKHGPPVFSWSANDGNRTGRREVAQFFAAAARFGIRSGLSISVPVGFKDRMIFTMASADTAAVIDADIDPVTAAVAVTFIHSRLGRMTDDASPAADIRLSPREAECLRWFADGMSMPDIAAILGIGYRSVRSYLDEATRKLGAINSRQAATIAVRLGLI